MDDVKLSHVDLEVIKSFLTNMEAEFGELTKNFGKIHDCLGMQFDHSIPGKVAVGMAPHVQDAIDAWPEELKGKAVSPAACFLQKTNPRAKKFDESKAKLFHTIAAKCLWTMQRARLDIQTAVSFLTSRVQSPDADDWKKSRECCCFQTAPWRTNSPCQLTTPTH